ncbi:MAG: aldehyde ferredoxin oxidoreductase family protein [Deltaproteobacteria bacterium]|nr:aldehyde ferredoxin oxidoreductase family protein [Deltaproteobacteria bacterium]
MKKNPGGYNGRILRINLSNKNIAHEEMDNLFCRKYLGGSGFVSYFLLNEIGKGSNPLGPENKLIFALGPVTGTSMIGSGRHSVGAQSPLGNGIALSESGEYWGAELKRAGYDIVIIEGKAEKPVFIRINNDGAEIHDAGNLWGMNTLEAQKAIRDRLNDKRSRVALIGPAGENLVKFACIMHGLYDAAGRGGLGAVMGSKNLKAIAVRGNKSPRVADPARLKEFRKWLSDNMQESPFIKILKEFGTGGPEMIAFESMGNMPVRNFRDGSFPGVKKINGEVIRDTIRIGMDSCFACPVRCKKQVGFEEPYRVNPAYGGPEYETLASLGSNCGIDNLKAIAKGNELCNAYSMDTISTGSVIAFAMECFEKGLLTAKDTDGLEMRFGDEAVMLKAIELIARRQGVGGLLADGTAGLAKRLGHQTDKFAIHVKGVDAGLHEPRIKPALGLGYMVNPIGADHVLNMQDDRFASDAGLRDVKTLGILEAMPMKEIGPSKVALFKYEQSKKMILNCLVMCAFPGSSFSYQQLADLTAAATGWDTGVVELLKIAERALTMARLFNIRQGLTGDDDRLPQRFFQPKTDGPVKKGLDREKMERAKRYYYTLMGWDPDTGIPLKDKCEELGIDQVLS